MNSGSWPFNLCSTRAREAITAFAHPPRLSGRRSFELLALKPGPEGE